MKFMIASSSVKRTQSISHKATLTSKEKLGLLLTGLAYVQFLIVLLDIILVAIPQTLLLLLILSSLLLSPILVTLSTLLLFWCTNKKIRIFTLLFNLPYIVIVAYVHIVLILSVF